MPRLWGGDVVAIIASGPSACREQAAAVEGRARLIVVNTSWRLAPGADLLYACDAEWWRAQAPGPNEFRGLRVTQDARVEGVLRVPSVVEPGLSLDPLRIHQGGNSGYQALNLAVLLGARRVLLLGYDMGAADGRRHWHGDHPAGLNNPDEGNFARWRTAFAATLPDLARAGVEVVNCTPGSALACFPRAELEEAICRS